MVVAAMSILNMFLYTCWPTNSGLMKLHFLLSTVTEFCNYVHPEGI